MDRHKYVQPNIAHLFQPQGQPDELEGAVFMENTLITEKIELKQQNRKQRGREWMHGARENTGRQKNVKTSTELDGVQFCVLHDLVIQSFTRLWKK